MRTLLLFALIALVGACARRGTEEASKAHDYLVPKELTAETDAELKTRTHALDVLRVTEGGRTYRALVWNDWGDDHLVVFYRQDGAAFRQYGGEDHLLASFGRPFLDGGHVAIVQQGSGAKLYVVPGANGRIDLVGAAGYTLTKSIELYDGGVQALTITRDRPDGG